MRLILMLLVLFSGVSLIACKNLIGSKFPTGMAQQDNELSPSSKPDDSDRKGHSAEDDSNYRIIATESDLPACEHANQLVIIYIDETREYKICENLLWRTTQVSHAHNEKPEAIEKPEAVEKPESIGKRERVEALEKPE